MAQPPPSKPPAIALPDAADAAQWRAWTKDLGWGVISPPEAGGSSIDARVQALEKAVLEEIQRGAVDPARIYLAGRGGAAAAVFYTVSRVPDLWAAAVALGGSPQPAIDSDRLYLANFSNVPVLWLSDGPDDQAPADKLKSAGMPLEWRSATGVQAGAIFEWMSQHARAEYPATVDCETNSPTFARCYWIRMTKFDAGERNEVLPTSRVTPDPSASLDLGGFGFNPGDPGPGVMVTFLPEKYSGPLKMGDRIVALDGREIPGGRSYVDTMAKFKEERAATVTVQRGKERVRIETHVVLPKRAAGVSARVQAKYLPEDHQIQIISRTVTEMRVTVPPQWLPAILNWNGVPLEKLDAPGCRLLSIEKELQNAAACQ